MPHIHDLIDFCVEVYVVYNNKVLLRKHDKYKIWLSVGGHIELDENPNEAAIREVKEEVGLNIELFYDGSVALGKVNEGYHELIPPQHLTIHKIPDKDKPKHKHVTLVYYATSETDELNLSDIEITEDCKWFTNEELDMLEIHTSNEERVKEYARQALDKLSS